MMVYIINYAGSCIGVYSRKKKMLEAFVKKCKKYRDKIVEELKDTLEGRCENEYIEKIDKSAIREILNLFQGEDYDSSLFSFEELSECTDADYSFDTLKMDE
jgi:hypothetical protein